MRPRQDQPDPQARGYLKLMQGTVMAIVATIISLACTSDHAPSQRPTAESNSIVAASKIATLAPLTQIRQMQSTPPTRQMPTSTYAKPNSTPVTYATTPSAPLRINTKPEYRRERARIRFPTVMATRPPAIATAVPTNTPQPQPEREPEPTPTDTTSGPTGSMPRWTKDGVSHDEQPTMRALDALRYDDNELYNLIIGMPFLQRHDHHDATALNSLSYIAYNDRKTAVGLIDAEHLSEGITEETAPRISLAYAETLYGGDPTQIMSPQRLAITSRDITVSGATATIAVAHPHTADPSRALDAIEEAVKRLTAYMGELPPETRHFIVNYAGVIPSVAQGANMGPSITMQSRHINDGGHKWLRHELAHHWFNSNEPWVEEGIAELLADVTAHEQPPQQVPTPSGCRGGSRISAMSQRTDAVPPLCLYRLSHAVFADLYNSLGPEAFQNVVTSLYHLSKGRYGVPLNIRRIRDAFADHEAELGKALQDRY